MMGLDRYRAHYKSNTIDNYDRAYCTQSLRVRRYSVDVDYMVDCLANGADPGREPRVIVEED